MEKTCRNGNPFFKTSACPVCPHCEKEHKDQEDFLNSFPAPARRALENHGITTLEKLATTPESVLLSYHGFGPSSIKIVKKLIN